MGEFSRLEHMVTALFPLVPWELVSGCVLYGVIVGNSHKSCTLRSYMLG
jgi:hypothetical protein